MWIGGLVPGGPPWSRRNPPGSGFTEIVRRAFRERAMVGVNVTSSVHAPPSASKCVPTAQSPPVQTNSAAFSPSIVIPTIVRATSLSFLTVTSSAREDPTGTEPNPMGLSPPGPRAGPMLTWFEVEGPSFVVGGVVVGGAVVGCVVVGVVLQETLVDEVVVPDVVGPDGRSAPQPDSAAPASAKMTPTARRRPIAHDGDTCGIRLSLRLPLSDPPPVGRGGSSGERRMR